jgi:hypothetical protein
MNGEDNLMNGEDNFINDEDNFINGELENTILITLKDTNNLVKILYEKISLLESENSKFKKQIYYLNKSLTELKKINNNNNNNCDILGTETDLNDFIINSVNNKNVFLKDNDDSFINESDIINEINFKVDKGDKVDRVDRVDRVDKVDRVDRGDKVDRVDRGDRGDKGDGDKVYKGDKGDVDKGDKSDGDKDYIKNKLKKLIIETQQHTINNNKRKKNILFTMR